MKPLYVICFYWEGDRWQNKDRPLPVSEEESYVKHLQRVGYVGKKVPSLYINNLYQGVKRFASRDFKFVCFTNERMQLNPAIEVRKFPMVTTKGVLPRLYMFSRAAGLFGHQVLCLDIDIIIVGNLEPFMSYEGEFCARSKFKPGEEYKLDGDIMSFSANDHTECKFWEPFISNLDRSVRMAKGRERYWMRHVAGQFADRWEPGLVVSYKRHVARKQKIPPGARIISCHGYPRPHQIKSAWVRQYWKQ